MFFWGVMGIVQRLRLKYLPEYTISVLLFEGQVVLPQIVYVDPILIVSTRKHRIRSAMPVREEP
jgi:hypothetical protein